MDSYSLHSKFCTKIIAHNHILEELINLYNHKKLHHAYLLQGIKGVGKASLAYFFTKLILASRGNIADTSLSDVNSQAVNLILNNSHPNLLTIEPEWDEKTQQYKGNITIEQTREIKTFLNSSSLTSNNHPKIVIIDAIDDLNLNAANSILKVLEEPNSNRLFLLICHNLAKILPTIRSRCLLQKFSPLSAAAIKEIITALNTTNEPDTSNRMLTSSEGSMQQILWFLDENNSAIYTLAQEIIANKDHSKINQLAESVKNLSSYNFRYLIESLLQPEKIIQPIKISSQNFKTKLFLEQDKVFNLDKASIITAFILDSIS